jgi:hypothetical protein
MKRIIISLLTVVMLIMMMLPTDIAVARGHGGHDPAATNETIESLVADFVFDIPECSSCSGIIFTDKSAGGVEPYSYYWDFGDGSNSTQENPRHRYASVGNYTVTLTVTDSAGDFASTSETVTLEPKETIVEPLSSNISIQGGVSSWPRCISGCTAKDVTVTKVWLVVHGCTGGAGNATADVYVTFDNNAKRYCFAFIADFWIDGVLYPENDDVVAQLGDIPAKTDYTAKVATIISWPCGAKLEVKDILLMWQTNDGNCEYNCGAYDAPSKCYFNATGLMLTGL